MSVRLMSMVFENQDLSSTEKLIMLALADHANDEGKSIYPSQITVSNKTGLARGTVNRHIQNLLDNDYLWNKGYKIERSNVLELEINVNKLKQYMGVTESDTLHIGVCDKRCNAELQGVSPRVTRGVTDDDTNHQLTINEPPLNKLNLSDDLFENCRLVYEAYYNKPVTDPASFTIMIKEFIKEGVKIEDYSNAIIAMKNHPKYKRATNPTSPKKWAIGYAYERNNPSKPKRGKRHESVEETLERLRKEEMAEQSHQVVDA